MKTLECLTRSPELQFTQKYEIEPDNYLRLLDYDRMDQDRKLKQQFEAQRQIQKSSISKKLRMKRQRLTKNKKNSSSRLPELGQTSSSSSSSSRKDTNKIVDLE